MTFHMGATYPSPTHKINPPRHFTDDQRTKFANAYRANKIILTQQLNTTCDALLALYNVQTGSNLTFNNNGATPNLAYSSFAHMANKTQAKLTGSLGGLCFSWDVEFGDANLIARRIIYQNVFPPQFKTFRNILHHCFPSEVLLAGLCHQVQSSSSQWQLHHHYCDNIHGVQNFHNLLMATRRTDLWLMQSTYLLFHVPNAQEEEEQESTSCFYLLGNQVLM